VKVQDGRVSEFSTHPDAAELMCNSG